MGFNYGTYPINDLYIEIDSLICEVLKSLEFGNTKHKNQLIVLIERAVYHGLQGN